MNTTLKQIGSLATASPFVFVGIVVYLHTVQSGYDPVHQFMSELAMGEHGGLMLYAFLSLAIALGALSIGLRLAGATVVLSALLLVGAAGFSGAGVIRLDGDPNLHIGLVATSFVTVALSMYLLPHSTPLFEGRAQKYLSWGLALGLGASVALGSGVIPNGVGQRLSALFLILWVIWVGTRVARQGKRSH